MTEMVYTDIVNIKSANCDNLTIYSGYHIEVAAAPSVRNVRSAEV